MGGCLHFLRPYGDSPGKGGCFMTSFEIVSIVIAIISLMISVVALVLKLFAYLDEKYKRK
jgi:hypothetical protein